MSSVADFRLSCNLSAAFLLVAQDLLRGHSLPHPSTKVILETLGAGKSRAYELANRVRETLSSLERAPGRPQKPKIEPATEICAELSRKVLDYLIRHPGASHQVGTRRMYSDDFRAFAVELCAQRPNVDSASIAEAILVPAPTLREWLRTCSDQGPSDTQAPSTPLSDALETSHDLHVKTVISTWRTFRGRFTAFCRYLKEQHQIPFGRDAIGSILKRAGVRLPKRRQGRLPDEKALRGGFDTFFPGAQWTGDGSPVCVALEGQSFAFNFELVIDTYSGAAVGIDVRDHEDANAAVAAFEDGKRTTGSEPLALLLDNRPSNHTPEVEGALNDTILMRSTLGRPQNKAHVEGAFGLFFQTVPPIIIDGATLHERARQILELIARTWARMLNYRPRKDHDGRSRVDLYRESIPTDDDVKRAKEEIEARARRQELAFETLRARQDPIVRTFLDDTFDRLGFIDPQSNIRSAIARYPFDRIIEGLAIYEGKKRAGSLPKDVDARYLLGIIKNRSQEHEGMAIAESLWAFRLEARDRVFTSLCGEHDALMNSIHTPKEHLQTWIDKAMATDAGIERFFWLTRAAEVVNAESMEQQHALFRVAVRRIHTTYRVPYGHRCAAVRFLAAARLPLD